MIHHVTGVPHLHLTHPKAGETALYLVRHGRTSGNVAGALQGWTDTPLDSHGVKQAHLVASRIAAEVRADALICSPLQRAHLTAQIIGNATGLTPIINPHLMEMNFGEFEGITVADIVRDHPDIARRMENIHDNDLAWPGGETRIRFHDRVWAAMLAILEDHIHQSSIVVAHGGVIGSFLAQVQGRNPNDWRSLSFANCSLTHLHVTPDHTVVHLLNDIVHLDLINPEVTDG